jgi:hypothetical protein
MNRAVALLDPLPDRAAVFLDDVALGAVLVRDVVSVPELHDYTRPEKRTSAASRKVFTPPATTACVLS